MEDRRLDEGQPSPEIDNPVEEIVSSPAAAGGDHGEVPLFHAGKPVGDNETNGSVGSNSQYGNTNPTDGSGVEKNTVAGDDAANGPGEEKPGGKEPPVKPGESPNTKAEAVTDVDADTVTVSAAGIDGEADAVDSSVIDANADDFAVYVTVSAADAENDSPAKVVEDDEYNAEELKREDEVQDRDQHDYGIASERASETTTMGADVAITLVTGTFDASSGLPGERNEVAISTDEAPEYDGGSAKGVSSASFAEPCTEDEAGGEVAGATHDASASASAVVADVFDAVGVVDEVASNGVDVTEEAGGNVVGSLARVTTVEDAAWRLVVPPADPKLDAEVASEFDAEPETKAYAAFDVVESKVEEKAGEQENVEELFAMTVDATASKVVVATTATPVVAGIEPSPPPSSNQASDRSPVVIPDGPARCSPLHAGCVSPSAGAAPQSHPPPPPVPLLEVAKDDKIPAPPSPPPLHPAPPSRGYSKAVAPAPPLPAMIKPAIKASASQSWPQQRQQNSTPPLLSLPADSLHAVASFLGTSDWSALSGCSRGANRACREVIRRVRMHGFRCATEAVTAWTRGEHADARELVALYIRSGVPIYPLCLGHSYHTLAWRMGVEAREMERLAAGTPGGDADGNNDDEGSGNINGANAETVNLSRSNVNTDPALSFDSDRRDESRSRSALAPILPKLDRFYTERYEARSRDGYYTPHLTYLDEKCLYWRHRKMEEEEGSTGVGLSAERRHSLTNAVSLRPPLPPAPGDAGGGNQQQIPLAGGPVLPPREGMPGMGLDYHQHPQFGMTVGQGAFLPGNGPAGTGGGVGVGATLFPPPLRGPPGVGLASRHAPGPPRRSTSTGTYAGFGVTSNTVATSLAPRRPKMSVRIHRHLADQDLLGRQGVNDEGGDMESAPLCLGVDFFHPHLTVPSAMSHTLSGSALGPREAIVHPFEVAPFHGHHPNHHTAMGYGFSQFANHQAPASPSYIPVPANESYAALLPGDPPALMDEMAGEAPEVAAADQVPSVADANTSDPAPLLVETPNTAAEAPDRFSLGGQAPWLPPPSRLQHAVSFGSGPELSGRMGGVWGVHDSSHHGVFATERSAVSDVSLEIYSSSSSGLPKGGDDSAVLCGDAGNYVISPSQLRKLCTRFLAYQCKLDNILAHGDSVGFNECLLDFWDEFLPLSAGVHFYDQHTPVPRMSSLRSFLTKPCPKSIGIVQCEIERIKISGRKGKKGVGMKGRLFPTYEYRVFVRDRRYGTGESSTGPPGEVRQDTVLMTAKNRGRNAGAAAAAAAAGVVGSPHVGSSSKRGVNNYFLYMPQHSDFDSHFRSVNDSSVFIDNVKNEDATTAPQSFQGLQQAGGSHNMELGRLQSNFIGTEFQIFSPCLNKGRESQQMPSTGFSSRLSSIAYSDGSDIDLPLPEDDLSSNQSGQSGSGSSGKLAAAPRGRMSSVTPPSSLQRGSLGQRFSSAARRSLSRGRKGRKNRSASEIGGRLAAPETEDAQMPPTSSSDAMTPEVASVGRKSSKRGSWPSLGRSSKVTSRRAIANSIATPDAASARGFVEPIVGEEENGVITYTANLLGNRPRIMDVCIPCVEGNGTVSGVWRRHCEGAVKEDSLPESMMARFKQLQQQLENPAPPPPLVAQDYDNNNNNNPPVNGGGNGQGVDIPAMGEVGVAPDVAGGDNAATSAHATFGNYGLMALQNRPPWWNVELGAFVLNFGGRVSVASVKNFQLCDRADQEHIMLQFGRIQGRHSFTMDFQYPLSAAQAFAIAISSLQSKISFG